MARRHDISGDWCRIGTCYPLIYKLCIHFNKFLLSMPCPDSEHNVTIVDKRIEDADNGIPVHHVIYRIEYGVLEISTQKRFTTDVKLVNDIMCLSSAMVSGKAGVKLMNKFRFKIDLGLHLYRGRNRKVKDPENKKVEISGKK